MFVPAAFAETDLTWLDRLLARDAFVSLVSTDADGLPRLTQLPVLYHRDADGVLIEGHWARANPQAQHSGLVLMLAHGPHAYVSPGWYPDKIAASRVPTWNYASAQLRGNLELIHDRSALADLVTRTSAHFESGIGQDWAFDPADDRQQRMLSGIVGFRFRPTQIQIKLKLSQNHPEANQRSVMAELARSNEATARDVGHWMQLRQAPLSPSPDDAAFPAAPAPHPTSGTSA